MDDNLLAPIEFSAEVIARDNTIKEIASCETCAHLYADAGYTFCARVWPGQFATTARSSECGQDAKFYSPGRGD